MKTIQNYINSVNENNVNNNTVNENKVTDFFKKRLFKDKKNNKGDFKEATDAIKKLPAEAVLRIAVIMCALMDDNYYTSLPTKTDAEYMFYDTEYLNDALGSDNMGMYLDEILRIMRACYLGYTDRNFAYNFTNMIRANSNGWATLDAVMNYKK